MKKKTDAKDLEKFFSEKSPKSKKSDEDAEWIFELLGWKKDGKKTS